MTTRTLVEIVQDLHRRASERQALAYELMRQALVKAASDSMAAYPQYNDHFDAYQICRITKRVETKGGPAFEAGDVVIGKRNFVGRSLSAYATIWSFRNGVDTSVSISYVEWL